MIPTYPTKSRIIIDILLRYRAMTSSKIAEMIGMSQQDVANILRKWRNTGRYGVYVKGNILDGRSGPPKNLWAIDRKAYKAFMEKKPAVRTPRIPPPEPKTQYRTVWRSCSPYYREAANE